MQMPQNLKQRTGWSMVHARKMKNGSEWSTVHARKTKNGIVWSTGRLRKRANALPRCVQKEKANHVSMILRPRGEGVVSVRRLRLRVGFAVAILKSWQTGDEARKSKSPPASFLIAFLRKGKGQSDFSDWPLFMPATTYAPTHFRVQYHRPSGA